GAVHGGAHGDLASAIGPDGGALDAEGALWVADAIGKRIVRMARGGRILEQIDTGDLGIFAAALGGPDGKTLFMAAAPDFIEANRRAKPEGRILVAEVDVPHAGRP
ncbi:SMP-30/gluconolactonase/LRE family protein, partial [Achromobacter dolens]|uniref:SMP-30/gluconolactonase/LRE family protein n=1 Tax=Achromobacter dolens TaxID=1287738 RepID=UPI0031D75798